MILLKKLIFAPIFLIAFTVLIYKLAPILKSYDFIFSLSSNTFIELAFLSLLILLSGLLFTLFVSLAQDLKLTLPIALLASLVPILLIEMPLVLILSVAVFVGLLLINISLDNSLKSYLTFNPHSLLGPSIRHLSTLLILSFSLIYFFSVNQTISQKGFEIPDSLIDTALKMSPMSLSQQEDSPSPQLPSITPEQLNLLKQNPDLLKQYGLDPSILDNLDNPSQTLKPQEINNNLIKQTVKNQIQGFVKPYQSLIPILLAALLFLTFTSLTSFLNLLIYPFLWITFYILEKTGYIKFTEEMRPVKKLVV